MSPELFKLLVSLGLIRPSGPQEGQMPLRPMLGNAGLNMLGNGTVMPPTRIPNAYRGMLGPTLDQLGRQRPQAQQPYQAI